MDEKTEISRYSLQFTQDELTMLGQTADALSAYMGSVVLAEIGRDGDTEWVIFARAIGQDEEPDDEIVHVQMGGPSARIVGQQGGLDTMSEKLDCEFLWAISLTEDPDERFLRLDQDGEVFDSASELAVLLPFSLQEPEMPLDDEDEDDVERDSDDDPLDTGPAGHSPTLH